MNQIKDVADLVINNYDNCEQAIYNPSNQNFQRHTIINGLSKKKSRLIIKMRTDEYYDLNYIANTDFKDRIYSLDLVTRNIFYNSGMFHFSDKLFICDKYRVQEGLKKLINLLSVPSNTLNELTSKRIAPEELIHTSILTTYG